MFDQVLNEIFVIAMVCIVLPAVVIATILMVTGRRRSNRSGQHTGAAEIVTISPLRRDGRGIR
jgi:hypothetical protein